MSQVDLRAVGVVVSIESSPDKPDSKDLMQMRKTKCTARKLCEERSRKQTLDLSNEKRLSDEKGPEIGRTPFTLAVHS